MNIIEACKSGNKFRRPEWSTPGYFWEYVDGNIQDYEGCIIDEIEISDALATDYELYEDGIRPKEAGEVWSYRSHEKYMTFLKGNDETLWARNITLGTEHVLDGVTHGQNGWERVFRPVEDGERVELEIIGKGPIDTVMVRADNFDKLLRENPDGKLIFITNKGEG